MMDIHQRANEFRALHAGQGAFVMPNPWDAGSARVLAAYGFEALATTSAGHAWSHGRRDYGVTRAQALDNARAIVEATELPISADLEDCFGPEPGETIRMAAGVGLVGGSIEDVQDGAVLPLDVAVARVAAAVLAARALPFPFMLTARAENFLTGRADLSDTIARLQAYDRAGADVLYAPGLPDLDAVRAVCAAVSRPVNVLATNPDWTVAALRAAGVRRISVGGSLARVALGALDRAAAQLQAGGFGYLADAMPAARVSVLMR